MKNSLKQRIVPALFCLGISGISMSVLGKPPGPPVTSVNVTNTPQVEVVNTPDVNVANKLDVSVTNTPQVEVANTLNMNITNTPDVNVANTANVNVTNTPDVNVVNGVDVNVTNDRPILVRTSNIYRFSGFSKVKLGGDSGIAALHSACQSSFGADARMCTSKEIFETPGLSSITTGQGWAHPVVVSEMLSSTNKHVMRDFSGLSAATLSMSCDGWSSISTGIIYTAGEGFRTSNCGVVRNVSCCATR